MKPIRFITSFKILIITMLLLAVLFNKSHSQKLMLAAILIWIGVMLCLLFRRKALSFVKSMYTHLESAAKTAKSEDAPNAAKQLIQNSVTAANHSQENKRMLQHISLRITEKLKSAYPDAVWQWEAKPELKEILDGKTFRIAADGMENYTHADVRFDQYARIRITPLIMGKFTSIAEDAKTACYTEKEKDPAVVDVQSWYDLIGRQVLESMITDLNANGHSSLAVKENGDIMIGRNKKDTLKGTLDHFPPKNYWKEFLQLLEEYELHGKEEKDRIIISWT